MNTAIFSEIYWPAVLVGTLAYFMLGAAWYSKALFGAKWAALVKLDTSDPNMKKGMGKMMAGSFVLMLIACIGLAIIIYRVQAPAEVLSGIKIGLLAGLCFATTAVSVSFIYESRPTGLYWIDCGYHTIGMVIASVIMVMWR